MEQLTRLTYLRKYHAELLKLFFSQIRNGKQLAERSELKQLIDDVQLEITNLETALNIPRNNTGD